MRSSFNNERYASGFIVPANYKWMARTFVAEVIVVVIGLIDQSYPKVTDEQVKALISVKEKCKSD